jgi:hypothetical protein
MNTIKQMCLTTREVQQGHLLRESLLMSFCIFVAMWVFGIHVDQNHLSMISMAVAGYAGLQMLASPAEMERYFWPKIWAMGAVALFSVILLYQAGPR